MGTLKESVNDTYDWSLYRIKELCSRRDFEEVVNGDSIRQELMNGYLIIIKTKK